MEKQGLLSFRILFEYFAGSFIYFIWVAMLFLANGRGCSRKFSRSGSPGVLLVMFLQAYSGSNVIMWWFFGIWVKTPKIMMEYVEGMLRESGRCPVLYRLSSEAVLAELWIMAESLCLTWKDNRTSWTWWHLLMFTLLRLWKLKSWTKKLQST